MTQRFYLVWLFGLSLFVACSGTRPIQLELSHEPLQRLEWDPLTLGRQAMPSFRFSPMVRVTGVGDLMLGSWVVHVLERRGAEYPFDSTRVIIERADIAIANLEAPFTRASEAFPDKKFTFKVPPLYAEGVSGSGFDVVNLANNHMLDYGCKGLETTLETLSAHSIAAVGAGSHRSAACDPVYLERQGMTLAFLGFSFTFPRAFWARPDRCGTCHPGESLMQDLVGEAREKADVVVVSFHWGQEKRTTPKPYQIFFAQRAIDSGADLVLGHHPHVLQGLQWYRGKLIAYSLGNYAFGSYSETARTSMILEVNLAPKRTLYGRVIPISVYNSQVNFQPKVLRGAERHQVIQQLNDWSAELNAGKILIEPDGRLVPPEGERTGRMRVD